MCMALQIAHKIYQNESQSHKTNNIREYQILAVDLLIGTGFMQVRSLVVHQDHI